MRQFWLLMLLAVSLGSCKDESFLQLEARGEILNYFPSANNNLSYRSVADTINFSVLRDEIYFENENFRVDAGNLRDFEKLRLQRRALSLFSDTFDFQIDYLLQVLYEPSSPTWSASALSVQLKDQNTPLEIFYLDSVNCRSEDCQFADTLELDSVQYYNVFYLAADSTKPAIYINEQQGLVAFRTIKNKFYQRIK